MDSFSLVQRFSLILILFLFKLYAKTLNFKWILKEKMQIAARVSFRQRGARPSSVL